MGEEEEMLVQSDFGGDSNQAEGTSIRCSRI